MPRSTAPTRPPTSRWGVRRARTSAPSRWAVSTATLPALTAEEAVAYDAPGPADPPVDPAVDPPSDPSSADPLSTDRITAGSPGGGGRDAMDVDELHAVARQAAGQLRSLAEQELDDADTSRLDACVTELRKLEGTLHVLQAKVVDYAQRTNAHTDAGLTDTGSYLRDRLGVSGREAKRRTEFAKDLERLGATTAALADGRIAAEHAQAIGRATRDDRLGDPAETEQDLLDMAECSSPEQLRDDIRRREQAIDPERRRRQENLAHRQRRASLSRRDDGMWELRALLDPEAGERVAVALDAFTTPDPPGTPRDERRRPEQRAADGLVELAEAALRAGDRLVGGVRPHVSVTIPIEGLEPRSGEVGVTERRAVLSPQAIQRLLCDAAVSRVLTRGSSEVLDVGRATRTWTASQRRAMVVRDGGCRGPGCDRPPAWCDAHHVVWWSRGGRSDLSNGLLLCRSHHRLVHEGGWSLSFDATTAEATFRSPSGRIERSTLPNGQRYQPAG